MWILQAIVEDAPEPRTFVLPAGSFRVGRKDELTTHILILNDKAISREHARIVIDTLPAAADSSAKAQATFIDSSRFGSSVNGKAVKAESEALVHDSLIDFSNHSKSSCAKFRFTWDPVVLCVPSPSPDIAAAAAQLTIPCESRWSDACTHLLVSGGSASLTGATACAAAEGKAIVTADWLQACLARPAVRDPLPECVQYAAPIEQALLPGGAKAKVSAAAFDKSSAQGSCLAASTCIWPSSCQDGDLEAAVKLAGGHILPANLAKGPEARRKGAFVLIDGIEGSILALPTRLQKLPWTSPDLLAAVIISGGAITLQSVLHQSPAATAAARTRPAKRAATSPAPTASVTRSQGTGATHGSSVATDLTTVAEDAHATPQSQRSRASKAPLLLHTSEALPTSPPRTGYGQELRAAAHGDGGDEAGVSAAEGDRAGAGGISRDPGRVANPDEVREEGAVVGMDAGGMESTAQGATPKGRKRKKAVIEHSPHEGGQASAGKAKKSRRGGDGRSPIAEPSERPSSAIRSLANEQNADNAATHSRASAAEASALALTPASLAGVSHQQMAHVTAWRASVTPGWVRRRHHETQEEGAQDPTFAHVSSSVLLSADQSSPGTNSHAQPALGQRTQAAAAAAVAARATSSVMEAALADGDLDGDHVAQRVGRGPAGGSDVLGALEVGGQGSVGEDVELGAGNCTVEESLIVKLHAPLANPAPTPPQYAGVPNFKAFRKQQLGPDGKRDFVTFDVKPYCERTARSGQDIEDEKREERRLKAADGLFAAKNLKPRKAVPSKKGGRA